MRGPIRKRGASVTNTLTDRSETQQKLNTIIKFTKNLTGNSFLTAMTALAAGNIV